MHLYGVAMGLEFTPLEKRQTDRYKAKALITELFNHILFEFMHLHLCEVETFIIKISI